VYEEQLHNLCLDHTLKQLLSDPTTAKQTDLLAVQFGQSHRIQRVYTVR